MNCSTLRGCSQCGGDDSFGLPLVPYPNIDRLYYCALALRVETLETIDFLAQWLADNEALLSALAALIGLIGVSYGLLHYVFARIARKPDDGASQPKNTAAISSQTEGTVATASRRPIHDDHVSLAVLRFETLSSNEGDEFMASGIASEVISLVTPVKDIRVSSRLSTFGWVSGNSGVQKAGEDINADFALTGSLQHVNERIRVIARLTDIQADCEVWTQTYDRQCSDLFEVQHDIARSIVGAILGEVRLAESLLADKASNHQLDAWGLVQKAYHFWLTTFSVEGILQACDYLRSALEIDPNYASARASLAMLLAQQMTTRICEDYDAVAAEASQMIEEAYRLAPNDIDVLENAGVVWQNLGERERASRALRHAIELAPLNLISRGYLALLLGFTGGEEGAEEAKQLLQENYAIAPKHPSTPYWHYFEAIAEQAAGDYPRSIELCKESLQRQPAWVFSYFLMANAHCVVGDLAAARTALEQAALINPNLTPQRCIANVDRITGDTDLTDTFVGGLIQSGLATREKSS